jgi:hypothetical protein
VCSVAGATVSFIGTGTCTVDANQAGDATFAAAPQLGQSFVVAASSTSTAPTLSSTPKEVTPVPMANSNFSAPSATVDPATGAITFAASLGDRGTFSWLLTFQNGKFGVFTASNSKCKKGFVRLNGKCRPSKIVFAKGTMVVAAPGTVSFTARPSASAMKALKNALKQKKGVPVTATFTFQSSRGGSPVSHTRSLTVKLRKKK